MLKGASNTPDKPKDKDRYLKGTIKIPVFCAKASIVDLPSILCSQRIHRFSLITEDITETLNTYELNARPSLFFYLEKYPFF